LIKIKHTKYKNTGILFELLVRQITADTLKGGNSPAIDILKEYFVNTSLGKEYKLYESVLKSKVITEGRATTFKVITYRIGIIFIFIFHTSNS